MLRKTEEAKFCLRKECVNRMGRFYRENPNEWDRNTTGRQRRSSKSVTSSRDYKWSDVVGPGCSRGDHEAWGGGRGAGPASGEPGKTLFSVLPTKYN